MGEPPKHPKIYHITHVENLPAIIKSGGLLSDAQMMPRGGPATAIGMTKIKKRRLNEIVVDCLGSECVGAYVPFYFCPRSVMLHFIWCNTSEEMSYKGGQEEVVHLGANLYEVIDWCEQQGRPWAFSLGNAGAFSVTFETGRENLGHLDWDAIETHWFMNRAVREKKQAELLVHDTFPWSLVKIIGTHSAPVASRVEGMLKDAAHQPRVAIRPEWYYERKDSRS